MTEDERRASRWKPAMTGLVISAAGVLVLVALFTAANRRTPPGRTSGEWLILGCPAVIIGGLVAFVRGLWSRAPVFSFRNFLFTGLTMLIIGGFPWIYTGSGEGGGMLGTMLFLAVGLPGLVITLGAGFVALIGQATGG